MTYRVVQWSTGNVGRHSLVGIDVHPELELVGVFVSNPDKVGRDAGELAGLGRTLGVAATNDTEALLALKPDCIVHTGMADDRLFQAVADLEGFLRAGCNVVSSSPVMFQYPEADDPMAAPLVAAAKQARVSLFVNGVDPGFANDALPLVLSGICERIEEVRCSEVLNYNTYNQPMVLFDIMGFGRSMDDVPLLLSPGVLTSAWGGTVRQIAAGLGVSLTGITEWYEREPAPEDFDIPAGTVKAGTAAALHFEVRGMVGDQRGRRARARDPPARRPRGELAPTDRARVLPGRDQGRAHVHPRPTAHGHRRRSQHRRLEGDRHAPGQRRPGGHRRSAGARDRSGSPARDGEGTGRH